MDIGGNGGGAVCFAIVLAANVFVVVVNVNGGTGEDQDGVGVVQAQLQGGKSGGREVGRREGVVVWTMPACHCCQVPITRKRTI